MEVQPPKLRTLVKGVTINSQVDLIEATRDVVADAWATLIAPTLAANKVEKLADFHGLNYTLTGTIDWLKQQFGVTEISWKVKYDRDAKGNIIEDAEGNPIFKDEESEGSIFWLLCKGYDEFREKPITFMVRVSGNIREVPESWDDLRVSFVMESGIFPQGVNKLKANDFGDKLFFLLHKNGDKSTIMDDEEDY